MSIFHEQKMFMDVMGQKPDAKLYYDLVQEEVLETSVAWNKYAVAPTYENLAEVVDGAIDTIYVLAGMLNSLLGPDKALQSWQEVQRSNMSKVGPEGVIYREDGKVLKPSTYFKPDLFSILTTLDGRKGKGMQL